MELDGKVAIITGGTGGLGQLAVEAFAEAGATIVVPYRREASYRRLVDQLGERANSVDGFEADLTEEQAVGNLVEGTLDEHGRLDILINLAGGYTGGDFLATGLDTWDTMFDLNFRSCLLCLRAALPSMLEQNSGRIVTIGSRPALEPGAGSSAYATSKAAVIALTRSVAREVRTTGVTVNCLAPSTIDTEENRKAMPKARAEHWVKPEEIASLLLYLCSDAAAAVNGAVIPIYGQL